MSEVPEYPVAAPQPPAAAPVWPDPPADTPAPPAPPAPPAEAAQPDAEPPAQPDGKDEIVRLLEEARGHLSAGIGQSALASLIRAVELLAGL